MSVLIKGMDIQKSETTKIYNARIIACSNGEIWFELAQTLGNGAEASEMWECIKKGANNERKTYTAEIFKQ